LNIAIILDALDLGGAERQAILCVSELRKLGHSADLIHYHPSVEYVQMLTQLQVTPIYVPAHSFSQRCRRLRTLFLERDYDVVHGFKMAAEVYAAVAGAWAGVPRRFGSFRNIYNLSFRYCVLHHLVDKGLDGWIVNSKVGAESMARYTRIHPRKILVLRNALCTEVFSAPVCGDSAKTKLGLSPDSFVITLIARLEPAKNHRMFIDVASLVLRRAPQARFLVVGKGSLGDALKRYASEKGLSNTMIFLGERSDVAEILAATDVSALTSDFEGLPNVIIEAMSAGKPIVCTDYKGHDELMSPESNALISPCRNAEAFAENVLRLIQDEPLRRRLGSNAAHYAQKNFSPEAMARNLERIYLHNDSDEGQSSN